MSDSNWIQTVHLNQFRNFTQQSVNLSPGLNLVTGDNGQGKTNLLEAIHFICAAHSQRTRRDKDLIQWEQPYFVIRTENDNWKRSVQIQTTGHKTVSINGEKSRKLSDLMGFLGVVALSPDDIEMVSGSPSERRRFLDGLFCQHSAEYLEALRKYQGTLKQRNQILKLGASDASVLEAYTIQLIKYGSIISSLRLQYLQKLTPLANEFYQGISRGQEELSIEYQKSYAAATSPQSETDLEAHGVDLNVSEPGAELADGSSEEEAASLPIKFSVESIQQQLTEAFQNVKQRELDRKSTLLGPHRDDLLFTLNGKSAKEFGSQGQKRSIALSLKLAAAKWLETLKGIPPILLLDDVFAELDPGRRKALGEWVRKKGQVLIASPRKEDLPFDVDRVIVVQKGGVVENS